MKADESDKDRLRKAYSDLRARLIADRDREQARIAASNEILRNIHKELTALERDQRHLELGSRVKRRVPRA